MFGLDGGVGAEWGAGRALAVRLQPVTLKGSREGDVLCAHAHRM